jgi:hypothetical protein
VEQTDPESPNAPPPIVKVTSVAESVVASDEQFSPRAETIAETTTPLVEETLGAQPNSPRAPSYSVSVLGSPHVGVIQLLPHDELCPPSQDIDTHSHSDTNEDALEVAQPVPNGNLSEASSSLASTPEVRLSGGSDSSISDMFSLSSLIPPQRL